MMILLGLVTVVYIAVGMFFMNKSVDCYYDDRKAFLWMVITIAWWVMIPAVCAQFGVFIIT